MVDFSRLRAARGEQNESAPQTQPTRSPQGRFGQQSGPSRGGINLQPRSPRYPRLPAPGDFEVVRVRRLGYTNVKGEEKGWAKWVARTGTGESIPQRCRLLATISVHQRF
jgi:hypothetical protein